VKLIGGAGALEEPIPFLPDCGSMYETRSNRLRQESFEKETGGDLTQVELTDSVAMSDVQSRNCQTLIEALRKLSAEDSRKVRVVQLRHFCGYSIEETAELLNISEATVELDWRLARLRREIYS